MFVKHRSRILLRKVGYLKKPKTKRNPLFYSQNTAWLKPNLPDGIVPYNDHDAPLIIKLQKIRLARKTRRPVTRGIRMRQVCRLDRQLHSTWAFLAPTSEGCGHSKGQRMPLSCQREFFQDTAVSFEDYKTFSRKWHERFHALMLM